MAQTMKKWLGLGLWLVGLSTAMAQTCGVDTPPSSVNRVSYKAGGKAMGHKKQVSTPVSSVFPAYVVAVSGRAVLAQRAGSAFAQPVSLKLGDALQRDDVVHTLGDGFLSVRYGDGTLNTMPSNARMQLQQLSKGVARAVLLGGTVHSKVVKQQNASKSTFEIQLPTVTVGVRGTDFGVSISPESQWLSVVEGLVSVRQNHSCAPAVAVKGGEGAVLSQVPIRPMALLPAPTVRNSDKAQRHAQYSEFDVAPVADAVAYRAQVARDAAFVDVVADVRSSSAAVRVNDANLADGFYYVRLNAVDGQDIDGMPSVYGFFKSRE